MGNCARKGEAIVFPGLWWQWLGATGEEAKGLACVLPPPGVHGGMGGWKAIENELAGLPVWGSGTWAGRMRQGLFYVS